MNKKTSTAKRLSAAYNNLSAREQKLILAMVGIMAMLSVVLVIGLFHRSLSDMEADAERYRQSLNLLAIAGPSYIERQQQIQGNTKVSQFSEEVLSNNDLKLTSFIATHAAATNITVSSYDEDQMPLGSKSGKDSGPIIVERQLRIDIREAQMDRLIEFLDRIEKSREPVVIKRVDVRSLRNNDNIRAMVVVSTYIRREKET